MLERVYIVADYHDGPRSGVADYRGTSHLYVGVFDDDKDEYADIYELRKTELKLHLELLKIDIRWGPLLLGDMDVKAHPELPEGRARYDTLRRLIDAQLGPIVRVRGSFKLDPSKKREPWSVEWVTIDV